MNLYKIDNYEHDGLYRMAGIGDLKFLKPKELGTLSITVDVPGKGSSLMSMKKTSKNCRKERQNFLRNPHQK